MNPARRPMMAANWKLNNTWDDCEVFAEGLRAELPEFFTKDEPPIDLLICPPYPYLALLGTLLEGSEVLVGGQDVSRFDAGAYTGDVAAKMLADLGCDYCLVGHSERRNVFGDTDELVGEKIQRLNDADVVPVLCIGEALPAREAGNAIEFTLKQLAAVESELRRCSADSLAVAYEPIWAIGTGRSAAPEDAQEMAAAIRNWLKEHLGQSIGETCPILYGGSVKPDNVAGYLSQADIDGALVGGASLQATSYSALVKAQLELLS